MPDPSSSKNHQPTLFYHSAVAFVRNIGVSKKFYTEVLGMTVEFDFGKNIILKGGITLWEISPAHIIPERLGINSVGDKKVNRFEFYFETADIEAVVQKVKASGVEFLHSLHEEPWGQKTIRLFDPDRHLIEIGESIETFVKRLCNENLTSEQISKKTSIPLDAVRGILKV
jgi:catechol 2,3-dioxygenase-like lactoylglutathione lyase family enzyme